MAPLTERHPSTRILALSIMIGGASAVLFSTIATACMWWSGATWKTALDTGWRLGVLLVLACPSGIAMATLLKYHFRVMESVLPQNVEVRGQEIRGAMNIEWEGADNWNGTVLDTLPAQEICNTATMIATLKYRDGIDPTRDLMCQQYGFSQPMWNSARRVLQEMNLVQGKQWARLSWEDVWSRLKRLRVDGNAIWCPQRRGMNIVHVSSECNQEKNSYILDRPPHPTEEGAKKAQF